MFLSIGMLKLNYFLADIFILSAEKQPIKLSWRKIECLPILDMPYPEYRLDYYLFSASDNLMFFMICFLCTRGISD